MCVCACMFNGQGIWGMLASFLCHEYLFQDPSVYLRLVAFLFYINSCYKPHTPHTPFSPLILFSSLNQCLVTLETLLRVWCGSVLAQSAHWGTFLLSTLLQPSLQTWWGMGLGPSGVHNLLVVHVRETFLNFLI